MFKNLQLPIILLLFSVLLFVSCSKTEKGSQLVDPTITAAKKWYSSSIHNNTGEPNWENARVTSTIKGQKKVVVPFPFSNRFEKRSRTIRRIIITERNGKFAGSVVLIMAKPEFVKKHPIFDPITFTGSAVRFDLNMNPLYGGYYENGVRKFNANYQVFRNKQAFENQAKPEITCFYYEDTYLDADGVFTVHGYSVCMDMGVGGGGGGNPWDPNPGGTGGGGTGGSGGDGGIGEGEFPYDPEPQEPQTDVSIVKNPCDERQTIDKNMKIPAYSAPLKELRDKLATSPNEWGVEQVLSAKYGAGKWIQKPIYSDGKIDQLKSNFTWNDKDGYTVGFVHSHPNGSTPTPQDIFDIVEWALDSPEFQSGWIEQDFFVNNASVTIVTKSNNFIVTLNDWNQIKSLHESFKSNPAAFEDNFQAKSAEYRSGVAALSVIFGSSINLYIDPLDGGGVMPVLFNGTSKEVIAIPCK
jgi:hypothetical protein